MSDVYRRCGCRRDDKRSYGPLPDRATDAQKAAACPLLLSDPKHGSWGFAVSGGVHSGTGKRVQVRRMGFATKREAQQERAKVINDLATGRFKPDRKLTVGEYLPLWLKRAESRGMRASTLRMYQRYVDNDLLPELAAVKLIDLRRFHVDKLIRKLQDDGRGVTTIRRIHATLSSALSAAERLDLIDSNPASKIDLPSASQAKLRPWEPDQVRTFLDTAAAHRLSALFELAVFTGMRRGELCGLRWQDVDLATRRIAVRQQRVQLGREVVVGPIKTDSGQDRNVTMGDEAAGALLAWKMRQDGERESWGGAWHDTGYVFTREDGEPLRPATVSRIFDNIVTKSGLPHAKFHALRHVHASLMLAAGVTIAAVSKRLGHSTIAVTADLYSHLLADADRAAADAAEGILPSKRTAVAHTSHTQSENAGPIETGEPVTRPAFTGGGE